MDSDFDRGIYYGCIIKGDLLGAIKYVPFFELRSCLHIQFFYGIIKFNFNIFGRFLDGTAVGRALYKRNRQAGL